jgi:hypothetical protein
MIIFPIGAGYSSLLSIAARAAGANRNGPGPAGCTDPQANGYDLAAIMIVGTAPNTTIYHNVVHNVQGLDSDRLLLWHSGYIKCHSRIQRRLQQ